MNKCAFYFAVFVLQKGVVKEPLLVVSGFEQSDLFEHLSFKKENETIIPEVYDKSYINMPHSLITWQSETHFGQINGYHFWSLH